MPRKAAGLLYISCLVQEIADKPLAKGRLFLFGPVCQIGYEQARRLDNHIEYLRQ